MAGKDTIENLTWVRFLAAAIGLAFIIMMVTAMFSAQDSYYSKGHFKEPLSLGEQLNTFQDNVDRSIHRGAGEVL
jgi:hypothetical protein